MLALAPDQIEVDGYTICRLAPELAPSVTRLVTRVYGESYYPADLYDPAQIQSLNACDRLVSVVALDAASEVVGHYALECSPESEVAEASDALVDPDHRHHRLMEEMRLFLRREAIRLELAGIVGYAVTNHLFTQKADEHIGAHPTGIALGLWPRSFHNMPQPLPQRMSFVLYFRYLKPPARVAHDVVTRHQAAIARIYEPFGLPIDALPPAAASGSGRIEVEYEAPMTSGTIRVRQTGADSAAAIAQALSGFRAQGAKACLLELPLAQAATAELCRAAESRGFFFCGVGPAFLEDGDALLLQWLDETIDPALIQIENPRSADLLAYVANDHRAVSRA